MGTDDSEILKKQIKMVIGQLGWKMNQLARVIYTEEHEIDNDDEIKRFEETFKKQFQRKSDNTERFKRYLRIISMHPDFVRLDMVLPVYVENERLSKRMIDKMKNISKLIDE
ncbi:hypothetical protein [Marinicellulosiphila megalodicopiae]|uniref:hypothetical protein n=1 Tax=Marinicellulosiphila megalodicopiae TaxID=2724896 RepID=UPI003BB20615